MVLHEKRSSCARLALDTKHLADDFVFIPLKYLHWKQHAHHHMPRGQTRLHTFGHAHNSIVPLNYSCCGKSHIIKEKLITTTSHICMYLCHTCANCSLSWVPVQFLSPLPKHKWHQSPSGSFTWLYGRRSRPCWRKVASLISINSLNNTHSHTNEKQNQS